MKSILLSKVSLLVLWVALSYHGISAHEGHVHAEVPTDGSGDIGGIISVTEQGKRNLGIVVAEAEIAELEKTTEAIVEITPDPSRTAVLSSRIPGKVKKIHAISGQSVSLGKPLVLIESFQPGNPPPSVSYSAPISGTVTHWDAEVGESVEPNGHLAEIIDLSEVFAELNLFEGQVKQIKLGQTVRVYVESFPDESFESTIELISGKLDPKTRVLKAYARIKNPELRLRPHMRGRAHIVTENLDAVIAVPHRAITGDPANLYTFVQTDDKGLEYEQRRVVIGSSDDRITEVVEGVLPGELVVTSGNYQLQFVEGKAKSSDSESAEDDQHAHGEKADHHAHNGRMHSWLNLRLFFALLVGLAVSIAVNIYYAAGQNKLAAD